MIINNNNNKIIHVIEIESIGVDYGQSLFCLLAGRVRAEDRHKKNDCVKPPQIQISCSHFFLVPVFSLCTTHYKEAKEELPVVYHKWRAMGSNPIWNLDFF